MGTSINQIKVVAQVKPAPVIKVSARVAGPKGDPGASASNLVQSVNGRQGVVTGLAEASALALKADASSLAAVATTGAYADLTGKPTIPAAQVNADWSASSGVAQILNKPTIPTVSDATSSSKGIVQLAGDLGGDGYQSDN